MKILSKVLQKLAIVGLFGFFVLILATPACTFDNAEEFIAAQRNDTISDTTDQCDTTNLYYGDFTPIFNGICSSCHNSGSTPRQGIKMDNYQNVINSFNTGLVLPAIKHTGPYKMPRGQSKLPDCDIRKIEAWYNAGMPEKPE